MEPIVPTLALFKPAEAEAITGLSTVLQRDYRHRGFLPKFAGHARFDIFQLAEMYVLNLLSERGFWPDIFAPTAKVAADGVAFHALRFADCYDGDDANIEQFCAISNHPNRRVMEAFNRRQDVERFLIIWANGKAEFVDSLDRAFAEDPTSPGAASLNQEGPVTVCNLVHLGGKFAARAASVGRPFVRLVRSGRQADGE